MSPALPTSQINDHIEHDIDACESLLQLLHGERDALKDRQLVLLEDIIEQKTLYLQKLEHSANVRSQWLQQGGNQPQDNEKAWLELLEQHDSALVSRWQTLRELMHRCQNENEVNGKVLARKQATYSRLVNIVRGQSEAPDLYNAKGNRGSGQSGQNLGEA